MGEAWEIPNGCRNLRVIEVIIGKVQPLKVNKTEEGAVGVDRAVETTATKIKPNHMTRLHFQINQSLQYQSRDLIRGLLVKKPQHRLGVKRGATDIKQHPFCEGVNWALIRCSTPPEVPRPMEPDLPGKFGAVDPVGVGSNSEKDGRGRCEVLG